MLQRTPRRRENVQVSTLRERIKIASAQVSKAPLKVKVVVFVAVLYLLSPIDLIPDFIPVLGQMDDILVITLVTKYVKKHLPDFNLPR